jgi:drug/metabolite transporter (DMT)-like permease
LKQDNYGVCSAQFSSPPTLLDWSPGLNTYALTVAQLGAVAFVCWFGALSDGYQAPPTTDVWVAIIFTAVFATAIAFFVQTWAQSYMDASRVAIILTSEVVFAAAIAVGVGQELLSLKTLLGGAIMLAAMLLVEWPERNSSVRATPIGH